MGEDGQSDTVDDLPLLGPTRRAARLAAVSVAGLTHAGKVRPNNEDNFHIVRFGRYLRTVNTSLPADHLREDFEQSGYGFAVADGIGGHAAGEVASRMAISLLMDLVLDTPDWIFAREDAEMEAVISRAAWRFGRVNEAVVAAAKADRARGRMGTTLATAVSLGDDLVVAHVGDSRAYLFRGGRVEPLTRDHTAGVTLPPIRPGEAARIRIALTHAIGIPEAGGTPDVNRFKLADGDRLLLCTDGLTDPVDEGAIAEEMGRATVDEACQALIDRALAAGGPDNVTAVVASFRFPGAGA
jgi:serine/threonine protein phosphatase PrpC